MLILKFLKDIRRVYLEYKAEYLKQEVERIKRDMNEFAAAHDATIFPQHQP